MQVIKPQEGFQQKFLSCPADIVIGGGAAGAGKSFALLLEAVRYINVEGYGCVIFRRTSPQIRNEGGLWSESSKLYSSIGLIPTESNLTWTNPKNKSKIKFSHLEYEKNIYDWQGSQIPVIGFDELDHFTSKQFRYLLSRNRSTCGISPYVRGTCNPAPGTWLAELIDWYIGEDGYIIKERDGVIRYFYRHEGQMIWGSSVDEVLENAGEGIIKDRSLIKSFCFIEGDIHDNKELLEKDPGYLANLQSQDENERRKLLDKNWKIGKDKMCIFDYNKIDDIFTNHPSETKKCITNDVAGFGKDLAVIMSGTINHIKRIDIFTKSSTAQQVMCIEERRKEYHIAQSDCLIDQDGIGGGVVGGIIKQVEEKLEDGTTEITEITEGGYNGFSGGGTTKDDPKTGVKENYKNLKTQCAYRLAEYINKGDFRIDENFYVNGEKTDHVTIGGKYISIKELIKSDLRSFKRDKVDMDGKKCIINKKEQKILLSGRSPDCGDTLLMRTWFDLNNIQYWTL